MTDVTAESLLKAHGMRLTAQRREVLRLLLDHPGHHWTAEQVLRELKPTMPELARGTIYKSLNELVRQNVLEAIAGEGGTVLYGLRLVPHHHFVCERCHRYFDVQVAGCDALTILDEMSESGPRRGRARRVDRVDITFQGLCEDCVTR